MVCLGFKLGAAGWKAQMNPLSYGCTPFILFFICHIWLQFLYPIIVHLDHVIERISISNHIILTKYIKNKETPMLVKQLI